MCKVTALSTRYFIAFIRADSSKEGIFSRVLSPVRLNSKRSMVDYVQSHNPQAFAISHKTITKLSVDSDQRIPNSKGKIKNYFALPKKC